MFDRTVQAEQRNAGNGALLAFARLLLGAPDTAFCVLLTATGALGLGFGATVMALNTYAETFFPQRADGAVLGLNALLGLGTALAPVLVAIAVGVGAWWLLPHRGGVLSGADLRRRADRATQRLGRDCRRQRLDADRSGETAAPVLALCGRRISLRHSRNTQRNWAMLYLSGERGVSARGASFALTAFWVMVTVGRVLLAVISRHVPARWIYVGLPVLLLVVFQLSSRVQGETGGIVVFGLAGLACSAFLPLSISFGGDEFPYLAAVMAGELIAFYQLGYGIAAFGTGPLRDLIGLQYSTIFAAGSIVALMLVVIASFVIRGPLATRRSPPAKA
jgi:MFS family permease